MATCTWCLAEMTTAVTCTVDALHLDGRSVKMIPNGRRSGSGARRRCDDCGVASGGWHHPGCDLQRCPLCRRQLLSCGCRFDEDGPRDDGHDEGDDEEDPEQDDQFDTPLAPHGVDGNGAPTEMTSIGGVSVVVHRVDPYPLTDITTIEGIRCTTALRTVIDLATEVEPDHLVEMIADCLDRSLFTIEEADRRLVQPDMANHRGAERVRRALQRVR